MSHIPSSSPTHPPTTYLTSVQDFETHLCSTLSPWWTCLKNLCWEKKKQFLLSLLCKIVKHSTLHCTALVYNWRRPILIFIPIVFIRHQPFIFFKFCSLKHMIPPKELFRPFGPNCFSWLEVVFKKTLSNFKGICEII